MKQEIGIMRMLLCVCIVICMLSACGDDYGYYRRIELFKNCTKDTLFIGISYNGDHIDTLCEGRSCCFLDPEPMVRCDTTNSYLWGWDRIHVNDVMVCPDSICSIDYIHMLFEENNDTLYLDLVRYADVMKYSWDEVRAKKRYHRMVLVRDRHGYFDRNIKYQD